MSDGADNCKTCGSEASLCLMSEKPKVEGYKYWVQCRNPKCRIMTEFLPKNRALEVWNTRPQEDAKDKRIKQLEEALDDCNNNLSHCYAILKNRRSSHIAKQEVMGWFKKIRRKNKKASR